MNARLAQRFLIAAFAVCCALLLQVKAFDASPVKVTLQVDADRLKVGQTTTAHVVAQITPELREATERIFAWYVDLLNSAPSVVQIQPGAIVVPFSDSDPATSSTGTQEGANLRAIYNTFLGHPGAGHDDSIELFSIQIKAVGVGTASIRVAPGTTATALDKDFIVSTVGGDPIFGAVYTNAVTTISSFINTPPTLDPIANATIDEGKLVTFTALGHDLDVGQTLTYSLLGTVPANVNLNASTGVFTWTPSEAQGPAVYQFQLRVADNGNPSLTVTNQFTVTVREVNSAPFVNTPANQTKPELAPITLNCSAFDLDILAGQTPSTNHLIFSLVDPPAGALINTNTGVFTWTPSEAQGPSTNTIKVVVIDDGVPPLAGTNTFRIVVTEVNTAPTLAAPATQTISEASVLSVAFQPTDVDLPPNQLTFTLISNPPGVVLDSATGLITWNPTEAQGPSTNTIRVSVSDNANPPAFATNSFTVIVTELNSNPVLAFLPDRAVTEGTPLSFTVTATDPDLPAQTLTYALINPPPGASVNPTTGAFTWTPSEAQGPGSYTIVVQVTDNGSPTRSDTKSFEVTVNESNSAPIISVPAGQTNVTVPELKLLTVQFTAVDPDSPTNLITFSLLSPPTGALIDPISGIFTWTPNEAQGPGSYTIKVVAADNGSPVRLATNGIQVTVTETNSPPTVNAILNQTIAELSKLTVNITATDSDIPAQALAFSLINPPSGASIDESTGAFNWIPNEAQGPGQFIINVRVTEITPSGSGGLSGTNSFTVTVTEQNSPPRVVVPAGVTSPELVPISLNISASDSDVITGQTPVTNHFSFALLNPPQGASINPATGAFTWTPNETQGPGSFLIQVVATDDGAPPLSGTNLFLINVTEANLPPSIVAPPDQTVQELTPLNISFHAADPDFPTNTLTFLIISAPTGVTVNPTNGLLSWIPTEAQGPGVYPIQVAVSDNANPPLRSTNTVTITVTETNSAPVIGAILDQIVAEQTLLTVQIPANDPDLPVRPLNYSLTTAPSGAAINPTTGVFTWTPGVGLGPGDYIIGVRVTESGPSPLSATQTFKISVVKDLPAPRLRAVSQGLTGFNLELTGAPNTAYTLEYSTNLTNWTALTTLSLQTQTTANYLDALHALNSTQPKGFYRVKVGASATPNAATLKALSITSAGVNLRITGDPNTQYRLEFATDLPNWTPLTPITIPAAGTIDYLDATHLLGGTQKRGFYRAVTP